MRAPTFPFPKAAQTNSPGARDEKVLTFPSFLLGSQHIAPLKRHGSQKALLLWRDYFFLDEELTIANGYDGLTTHVELGISSLYEAN